MKKREKVLTKLTKTKNGVRKVESDHNPIVSQLKLRWNMKPKQKRLEIFNLKNKACQEKFKLETSTVWNNGALSSIFDEKDDLNILANRFMKKLDKIIYNC